MHNNHFSVVCSLAETYAQLYRRQTTNDDFKELDVGRIKRQAPLLTESDFRYAGKQVSRKDIEEQISASGVVFDLLYAVINFSIHFM